MIKKRADKYPLIGHCRKRQAGAKSDAYHNDREPINLLTNQVALLSIPRDFYAKIPEINLQTKINSVYQYGINSGNDSAKGRSAYFQHGRGYHRLEY